MEQFDLVIIGGGSAGMSAAIESYNLGIKDILILEKNNYLGGILNQCIHNGFGLQEFKEELTGPEFMTRFSKKVNELGIKYELNTNVLAISNDKVVSYSNKDGYKEVKAKAIILATGCYERNAGAISLGGDRPSGVYTAGQAQLYLNNYGKLVGKKVFILGSGDIGLIMARRMSLEGAKVLGVAELMPYSAGLNRNIVQCLQDFNIPLYLSHTVKEVIGPKGHLEKIVLAQVDERFNFIPGTEQEFECDTLLLSVGLVPNVDLLSKLGIHFAKSRGPVVNQYMETELEGLFASGNVLHVHDLVDYVVSEAREAAHGVYLYLNNKLPNTTEKSLVKPLKGVGYVVPNYVQKIDNDDKLIFKFRVAKPYKNINLVIKEGDKVIKKIYKLAIIPSEMEIVKIDKKLFELNGEDITVEVEEK